MKAKGNTNLLLNEVGNLMKDTEQAQMLNALWLWSLVARPATLVHELSDRIYGTEAEKG